jgi:hypothetical protein
MSHLIVDPRRIVSNGGVEPRPVGHNLVGGRSRCSDELGYGPARPGKTETYSVASTTNRSRVIRRMGDPLLDGGGTPRPNAVPDRFRR